MTTVILIFRILFIVLGSLTALAYLLFMLFQKLPKNSFSISTVDYIVFCAVALIFGFGTNNYYGLLAFLPLLLIKVMCYFLLKPKILSGSGRWVEVNWKKLTPRGFDRNVPRQVMDEMSKMPKDTHFLIPRLYMLIAVKFINRKMSKDMKKLPAGFSASQQQMAVGQFTTLIDNIVNLPKGRTEKKDFPFGVLRVTRL